MDIKESSASDLNAIAKCQAECFPSSYAVLLGTKTIAKSLEWFLVAKNRFLVHIEEDGRVVAFMGGFAPQYIGDGSKSGMLRHSMAIAAIQFLKKPWLLFHREVRKYAPAFFKNALQRLKKKKLDKSTATSSSDYLQCMQLTTIGVHPDYRRKGYAQKLLLKIEKIAALHKMPQLQLSVKRTNITAIKAYEKSGWHISGTLQDTYQMKKQL